MSDPWRIWHLIERLDGYGGARTLRHVAAHQAAAGDRVTVVALSAERRIVAELATRGAEVQALSARWDWDPIAAARLSWLNRKRGAALGVGFAWDLRSAEYAQIALPRDRQPRRIAMPSVVNLQATNEAAPGDLRSELGLDAGAKLVATVGPLVRRKHLDDAIWCFELVRVLHPDARLVIVGDGSDRTRLERLALAISEPGCVRFLGFRDDVPAVLAQVDALWQLEPAATTPAALLEGMAAGAPIIASDVPAMRAAIEHGVTGLLAPLGSRVEVVRATDDLWRDAEVARRLVEAARERIVGMRTLETALTRIDAL